MSPIYLNFVKRLNHVLKHWAAAGLADVSQTGGNREPVADYFEQQIKTHFQE